MRGASGRLRISGERVDLWAMEVPPQAEGENPAGEAPPGPAPKRRRRRWPIVVLALVGLGISLLAAAAWVVVYRPIWVLRPVLGAAGGDLRAEIEGARWRSPSELELVGLSVGGSNRVGMASVGFDWRELAGLESPEGVRESVRLSDITVDGLGKIGSARLDLDLGVAAAAAMRREGSLAGGASPAELVLHDVSAGATGSVSSVRFRFDLGQAMAAATDPAWRPGAGAPTAEIAISGVNLASTGRLDAAAIQFDLGSAIATAMGRTNWGGDGAAPPADVRLSGLSLLPTGRVGAVSGRMDIPAAIAAALRPDEGGPPADVTNLTEFVVSGISLGEYGGVDAVRARLDLPAAVRSILRGIRTGAQPELAIREIVVDRPHLSITREEILAIQQRSAAREAPKPGGPLVEIGRVEVNEGLLQVKNLGSGIPPLPIPIDQVISNVVFGASRDHPAAQRILTIHVRDWTLRSPYDALATVLRLQGIDISFSVAGLLENRLESIEFVEPIIFLGQDLFWFSELLQREAANLPPGKPWTVGNFGIRGGRVIVATQGEEELELPLVFASEQRDMRVGALQDMHLSAAIEVVPVSLDYRERYGIAVDNLRGKLEFALPRTREGANNVVNTLKADRIAWKDLSSSNVWVSVTFDVNGVYGQFGGEGYGGYINGDATVLFEDAREWVGSIAATEVDLGAAAADVIPEQVRLTGRGSGTVVVRGQERVIRECTGKFGLLDRGRLEVVALDELLGRIPAEWDMTRKDLAEIVLNAFRTYHYTSGEADFSYKPPLSFLRANFRGEEGKRDIDVSYRHDMETQTD